MIDQAEVLAALDRAADAAGTVGATAHMTADEMDFTSISEMAHELAQLERAGVLESDVSPIGSRFYARVETPEERAAADREWDALL